MKSGGSKKEDGDNRSECRLMKRETKMKNDCKRKRKEDGENGTTKTKERKAKKRNLENSENM